MKSLFCLKAKNGLGRFAPSALRHHNMTIDENMLCYCYCPRWNALEGFSQFVRSFFGEVTVGVRGIDERDLSAPTQTAPQWVAFGSDRDYGVDKVSRPPHDDGLG